MASLAAYGGAQLAPLVVCPTGMDHSSRAYLGHFWRAPKVIRSDGRYVRDFFYVEDGAAAYTLLAERLAERPELSGRAFNFSNETAVSVQDLVRRILSLMNSPLEADVRNEATHETREQFLTAARARTELGWKPLFSLDEGLRRTIDWYRQLLRDDH